MSSSLPGAWRRLAQCKPNDYLFYGGRSDQAHAKALCHGCPVRLDCLAYALDTREPFGVWGGMTEFERKSLLRKRSDIRSWARSLRALGESTPT